ncbi:MAG: hypothetical protein E7478_10140 [Ruminococcaceae bacterium]|nr:hypothetical protein [Oscillospiraceae bacterium]
MYIEKYWGNYIGGSDDSMTLLEYLAAKRKEQLTVGEIFADSGLDKLDDISQSDGALSLPVDGLDADIQYAIDIIADLAALLLECRKSGSIDLAELDMDEGIIIITASDEEHERINSALAAFAAEPSSYDISEMMDEDELSEMATVCEQLRKELYGE